MLPGYAVSADGRVRGPRRELSQIVDRYGYAYINTKARNNIRHHKVHRLVCEAFHGPAPVGCEVALLDGNSRNNAAENLRWVTHRENVGHQVAHGTLFSGTFGRALHPNAKLNEAQVAEIRATQGASTRALAKQYGVNQSQIVRIRNGQRWVA
jgi:hypothetical protein